MIKVGIVGATGYTGLQLVNLLKNHSEIEITDLLANTSAGQTFSSVYPSHISLEDRLCEEADMAALSKKCDVIFLALPHGVASKSVTDEIIGRCKVIDLGADFRLKDASVYEKWYKTEHFGKELLSKSVYGLSEIYREQIKTARLVANPGCYTTCSILSLLPLLKNQLIEPSSIIIDAKSGVSGAGRGVSLQAQYCEVNENIKAYGIATHRHTPEIEQELSAAADSEIKITFTPHLIPVNRGILSVAYATLKPNVRSKQIGEAFQDSYADEYFIRLRDSKNMPQTNFVRGSNFFDVGFTLDERTNRVIVVGAIDNLMKGASSQAVQNMNILFGIEEKTGIDMFPVYI